nr:ABC transporter ATP-binding protein [Anaerolineae bacterium]
MLTAHSLTIGYRHPRQPLAVVASGISVALHSGEMVCLLGPNGVGKSTLLRTMTAMQPLLGGQVRVMGDDIGALKPKELARRISVVLTDRINVGNMSAYGLVALGRHPYTDWLGRLSGRDESVVRNAFEAVGAAELASRRVNELSDGERQKILIARALAQDPFIMVLDEPTAFLDLPNRANVMRILRDLAHHTNRAIVLSTHDLDMALRSADRIWLMGQDGTLHIGAPEDLVLSGRFEAVFRGEGVVFDPATGAFSMERATGQRVQVSGEGIALTWTERALKRAGFLITSDGVSPLVQIEDHGDGLSPTWYLRQAGRESIHHSIHDLLAALGNT